LRDRLQTAFVDRPRAVTQALAGLERGPDSRVRLEALEFVVGRDMRIFVIQMHDKADRDPSFVEVVNERAAAGSGVERPALGVNHQSGSMLFRGTLPTLLNAAAVMC